MGYTYMINHVPFIFYFLFFTSWLLYFVIYCLDAFVISKHDDLLWEGFESLYKSMGMQNLIKAGEMQVRRRSTAPINEFRMISKTLSSDDKLPPLTQSQSLHVYVLYK